MASLQKQGGVHQFILKRGYTWPAWGAQRKYEVEAWGCKRMLNAEPGVLGPGCLMVNTVAGLLPAFGADALSVMVLL